MKWNSPLLSHPKKAGRTALVHLTQSAIVAALYLALTLATSFMSFSMIQLRAAEALSALPILFPAAVPGLFLGCLLANLLNPAPLGLLDVIGGSSVTFLAAWLSFRLGRPWRRLLAEETGKGKRRKGISSWWKLIRALLPPVLLNGLIVGSYLPFLLSPGRVSPGLLATSVGSILFSQAVIVFGLGLPLVTALDQTPWARRVYLAEYKEGEEDVEN